MTDLPQIAKLLRYYCLVSTSAAGSGHLTSSLSAVELMAVLYFGGFLRYDLKNPDNPHNDRVIFSKGHAVPLFYALYAVAGQLSEVELKQLRQFDSPLEGHPSPRFYYTEAATGSLGQGLSVGIGMALNAKYLDQLDYKTYVLLGDSEMSEGQIWEAMQLAAYYKLNNLVAMVDVNRLGQRGETMQGHNLENYACKAEAFGWETKIINGHDLEKVTQAYQATGGRQLKPTMILARTIKGQGVSFLADQEGWHGKVLNKQQLGQALSELGELNTGLQAKILLPSAQNQITTKSQSEPKIDAYLIQPSNNKLATRKAYGNGLLKVALHNPRVVSLDAEVSNSTYAQVLKLALPVQFFEMFIAEQNMVSLAVGLSRMGKIPFVSTFAAFLTRAFDQIRMAQYSQANLKLVGSHAGVSIGQDGPSQMGLEDIAMMRSIRDSVVLYPSDAIATEKLVAIMAQHQGISYLRTTRIDTPIIYHQQEKFELGGSKVVRSSEQDQVTVAAAGITLHEALSAHSQLKAQGILARIIDLYSIKPLDTETLQAAARETQAVITVEDHYQAGGIGEAVKATLVNQSTPIYSLCVTKVPHSGRPKQLLAYEQIDAAAIVEKVKTLL